MDRTTFIGGSDVVRLVNGDWENLYLEKIGEKQPDDLSRYDCRLLADNPYRYEEHTYPER